MLHSAAVRLRAGSARFSQTIDGFVFDAVVVVCLRVCRCHVASRRVSVSKFAPFQQYGDVYNSTLTRREIFVARGWLYNSQARLDARCIQTTFAGGTPSRCSQTLAREIRATKEEAERANISPLPLANNCRRRVDQLRA